MRKAATILAVTILVPGAASAYPSMSGAASIAPVWSLVGASPEPSWRFTQTATTNRLVIADVVDWSVVWAVGGGEMGHPNDGSVVRTTDGGRTWQNVTPPGGAAEVFRDVEATDGDHAIVLAVGPPSQIYRTADGGATWHVVFEDAEPNAFYDCVAFFDHRQGIAVSDPVGGRFRLAGTEDGGRSWRILRNVKMPPALGDEGARATGTCLQAAGKRAWFGTATPAGVNARVFTTGDGGRSWSVATTPLPGGDTGGVRSLSFRDPRHGVAVGGDPPPPTGTTDTGVAVISSDGGRSWSPGGATSSFRNGVSWVPGHRRTLIAVGTGSDVSTDGGQTWRRFDDTFLLGVDCRPGVGCWAVGGGGLAAKLSINH
jgi:photosystem II stability/assembly factor-like uncharacterized protein